MATAIYTAFLDEMKGTMTTYKPSGTSAIIPSASANQLFSSAEDITWSSSPAVNWDTVSMSIYADADVSTPAYTFTNDTNTGYYTNNTNAGTFTIDWGNNGILTYEENLPVEPEPVTGNYGGTANSWDSFTLVVTPDEELSIETVPTIQNALPLKVSIEPSFYEDLPDKAQ